MTPPTQPTQVLGATQPTQPVTPPAVSTSAAAGRTERMFPEVPAPRIGADSWGKGFSDNKSAALTIDKSGMDRLRPSGQPPPARRADDDSGGSGGGVSEFFRLRKITLGETVNRIKKVSESWKSENVELLFTVVSVKAAQCVAGTRRDCDDIDKANERFSEKHLKRGKIKNFFGSDDKDKDEKK